MKKRILAGALSLVMLFSLMPASVLAAENDVPDSAPASACAQLEDCGGGVHAVDCPLYAAPAGPSEAAEDGASEEEGTACGALPGCVGEAHDPECPLYVEPQEKPAEEDHSVPEEVQAFGDAAAALDSELPDTIEAARTAYEALSEEQKAREDVAAGYAALLDAESRLNAPMDLAPTAENAVYVSKSGNDDSNDGSQSTPYATLAKAVKEATDGTTIYLLSDLEITANARITDKHLTITSEEGKTYTLTRGTDFEPTSDNHQSHYNPGFIEVTTNGSEASENASSVTLTNIILDDKGIHEGTYFAQTNVDVTGAANGNLDHVQDSMITAHGLENRAVHIILGNGAVLKDFGGMSAVYGTTNAHITMQAGSEIYDEAVTDRKASADQKVKGETGPAGAVWLQGAEFVMEDGAEIHDVVGRAVYADGGKASIGGTISGITGDKDMWQGASGVAIHVRGGADVTLTGTVADITAPSTDNTAVEAINSDFEAADGSTILQVTNMMAVYAHDQGNDYSHKMLLNGTITDCVTTGSLMRSWYANITLGTSGVIEQCEATGAGGLLYTNNGSQYTIRGKIIDNTASKGVMYLGNYGGGETYATLEEGGLIANNSSYGVQINGANSGAYFVMNGGEISGNGTGVYMREKATNHFIMNGGKIINNRSAGISHTFGNRTYIQLNGGEISGNGGNYEISASSGSANDSKNYLLLKKDVLKGNRCINLAFGRVTLDEDYTDISLGKASTDAANKIKGDVASEKGADWKNQSYSALWFKPTMESFHFTMPRPDVDNILYAGYIPLNAEGTPADGAQLTLIQLEGNDATGSVTTTDILDISLTGLTPDTPYALMLIKSPILIVRPVDLAKYVTGDDKHDGESYVNCFPDPRYEGIPENAKITIGEQTWEPGVHGGAQYPFTINYYEQDGTQIKDDHASGTYIAKVEILPGLGVLPSNILINGQKFYLGTGTLSIRAASNAAAIENIEKVSSQVTTNEPSQSIDQAVAVMPDNVNYLVNGITGQVPNPGADIRLLQDEVLSAGGDDEDQYVRMMRERLEKKDPSLVVPSGGTPRQYAMKYLDLIDAHDSNLIITPNLKYGQSYDLYLPYPTGTDKNYEFQLFCFEDLDRTYTEKDYGENVGNIIERSEVSELEVTPTEFGPKVTIGRNDRLGAMALTWQQGEHTITASAGTGGTISPSGSVKVRHTDSETFTITPDSDYHISDVKVDGTSVGAVEVYTFDRVTGNHTIVAAFARNSSGGGGGTTYYTLSYDSNGGTEYKDERYRRNTVVELDKEPTRKGYTFTGWYADRKLTDEITSIKMTGNKTVYAGWRHDYAPDGLNSEDHVAYVAGYPDGTVRPDSPVTRAETATMLYRLLTDARRNEIDTEVNSFNDVSSTDWFVRMVSTMANGGYLDGYPDGTFGGNRPITRAEFVTMLVRFIGLENRACSFPDVSRDHWAYEFIATATNAGWIAGYTDGTFGPDRTITRAEAMTILNSVLNRGVNEKSELLNFKVWPDNPESAWYYYEIIEASNAHEYTGSRPSEDWTRILKDRL